MLTKFATAALAFVVGASAQFQQGYGQSPYQNRQSGQSAFKGAFGGHQAMKVPNIPAISG